jgi:hypothetical protein
MKSVVVHGALALVGLLLSYQTWTRKDDVEQAPGQTEIIECGPDQLEALEIETPSHTVKVAPKKTAQRPVYWITAQRKKPEPKPEDPNETPEKRAEREKAEQARKEADAKQARPYDADAPVTFLGNAKFDELLKSFSPLRAIRDIGPIDKGKEAQFGLEKPVTFLRMTCGGRKLTLEVGGSTYGGGDSYVRDSKTKRAYLVGGQMLLDLQSAQFKFQHTDLHDFALSDVDGASVQALGRERRLLQRNRTSREEARWVDAAAPDTRNELFGTWFTRVGRLKVKTFLPEGKQPGSDLNTQASSMQPVLTIDYELEGKPKGKLELVRVDTALGNFYYARTEATQRWTSLYDSVAKQVEDDVAMVVGAEEAAPSPAKDQKPAPAAAPAHPAPGESALPPGHPRLPRHP